MATKVKELIDQPEVVVAYKGDISFELLDSLMLSSNKKIDHFEANTRLRKKLNVIVVEVLQNIYHHFMKDSIFSEVPNRTIIFSIMRDANGYVISSSNFVSKLRAGQLKEKIEKLNVLSPEELKEHYREQLNSTDFSETGGAGLGLIDIARKSGQKIEFEFDWTDENFPIFNINIYIAAV